MALLAVPSLISLLGTVVRFFWSRLYAFWLFIIPFLASKLVQILGIAVITFTGVNLAFSALETYVYSEYSGMPTIAYTFLTLMGMDDVIAIIFSSYAIVLQYKILTKFAPRKAYANIGAGF